MVINAPAQIITAPAQLIIAPAQPPMTGAVVITALFVIEPNWLLPFNQTLYESITEWLRSTFIIVRKCSLPTLAEESTMICKSSFAECVQLSSPAPTSI